MGRRVFTIEFKREAVKLVRERGVTISQAAKDLGLHVTVLRNWVRDAQANGTAAFPGRGKQRPDNAEVARLRLELAKALTERDILKSHRLCLAGWVLRVAATQSECA
jgi:transposase